LAVHLVFTLVDIASAHFLTVACGDKTEKWKVAAKYGLSYQSSDIKVSFQSFDIGNLFGEIVQ